ncbi:MAG TPA: DM13 domain-containing protein [Micromonosporaceae bacterium]
MLAKLARKPLTWVALFVLAVGGGLGLYWFQPWKLFTSKTVNEALPSAAAPGPTQAPSSPDPDGSGGPVPSQPRNVLLASGRFITHEHQTTGSVQLIRLADGRVQLALADLATSDGPDLRVWLTDQPVLDGRDGWHVFDDGRYVEVGRLKANQGNQVYDVPAGTELTGLTSVTIWCKRFSVSFGAAELQAA